MDTILSRLYFFTCRAPESIVMLVLICNALASARDNPEPLLYSGAERILILSSLKGN